MFGYFRWVNLDKINSSKYFDRSLRLKRNTNSKWKQMFAFWNWNWYSIENRMLHVNFFLALCKMSVAIITAFICRLFSSWRARQMKCRNIHTLMRYILFVDNNASAYKEWHRKPRFLIPSKSINYSLFARKHESNLFVYYLCSAQWVENTSGLKRQT